MQFDLTWLELEDMFSVVSQKKKDQQDNLIYLCYKDLF